jgi:arsenate reductase
MPDRNVPAVQTVLFVCVENTFRSVLSEALFNAQAPRGWRARSAGVQAATVVNPIVGWLLRELGIQKWKTRPEQVTPNAIQEASRVITFGCVDRCPAGVAGKNEDWPIPGSTGKSDDQLRGIRDELRRRIRDLIQRLPKDTDARGGGE